MQVFGCNRNVAYQTRDKRWETAQAGKKDLSSRRRALARE